MEITLGTTVSEEVTMARLIARVESRKPFQWVRYGNGEWDLVLGLGTRTGSGSQVFSADLREAMRETVLNHFGKVMAIQNERYLRKAKLWPKIEAWLASRGVSIAWEYADVLHHASRDGSLAPFIRALDNPLLVGPRHLENLPISAEVMPIPDLNCWDDVDAIESGIRQHGQGRSVCISAGPTAKVLIHRLRNENMQLIDCGSLWDVYCGHPSRGYHQLITTETRRRNFNA